MNAIQHVHTFDARGISRRFRHAAIFGALDALEPGEAMRFVNDHDPLPLLSQLQQHYGAGLDIAYREREIGNVVIDFLRVEAAAAEEKGSNCCGGCC